MVARVDRALKDDLGIADGLAADNVYVLDPCCGTGAYLAETLRRIAANLEGKGLGALAGARVKQAATQRVFGFEIMPAPYVVAHLQVGLAMQELGAPLSEDDANSISSSDERAGVFLTNALTGWEPTVQKPLPFPELEEERDRAERVKQDTPVLVIIGNPPYNGFAGVAVDEERELSPSIPQHPPSAPPRGAGPQRSLRAVLFAWPNAASPKRRAGAWFAISPTTRGWTASPSPECASISWTPSTPSASTTSTATSTRRARPRPTARPTPAFSPRRTTRWGLQVGTAIATLVRKDDHAPAQSVAFSPPVGAGQAR